MMTALDTILWQAALDGPTHQGFWNILVGAAVSLVGGAVSRNAAKKRDEANQKAAAELAATPMVTETSSKTDTTSSQKNSSYVDVDRMRADAVRAGINPVAFIMSGGLAAYTQTQSDYSQTVTQDGKSVTTGHNAAAAAELARPTAPSMGEVISGAVQSGFNQYMDDRRVTQQQVFQKELVDRQLLGQQSSRTNGAGGPQSFYVPGRIVNGQLAVSNSPYPTGNPTRPGVGDVSVTNPWQSKQVDETVRDATAFTDRYGESELGEMLVLARNGFNDLWKNVTGLNAVERAAATASTWDKVAKGATGVWDNVTTGLNREIELLERSGNNLRRATYAPYTGAYTYQETNQGGGGGW